MSVSKYLEKLSDLDGKKVLITGGTSGIGLSIVKHLLKKNAHVVIMARNLKKVSAVKEKLDINDGIEVIEYDQSNYQSIKKAAEIVKEKHQDFYALILNAGVFCSNKSTLSPNGISQTIDTNFVGLKVFIDSLLPGLKGQHRFILQGSFVAGYRIKKIKSLEDKVSAWQQYLISKAGVETLYYHYLNMHLENISFYLVEPGLTSTDIIRDFPTPIKQMGRWLIKVVSHSNDKAALTAMKALEPSLSNATYIVPRGFLTFMGYPKIKKFPVKRYKKYLYDLVANI